MPVFDRRCQTCAWLTDFALEPVTDPHPPCPECGEATERYMAGHGPMVIPDTYSTPIVDSVMTKKTQVHYTRSERKARMKNNRLQEFVKFTPNNESDKGSLFCRWDAVSADQLRKMEAWMKARYPDAPEQALVAPE